MYTIALSQFIRTCTQEIRILQIYYSWKSISQQTDGPLKVDKFLRLEGEQNGESWGNGKRFWDDPPKLLILIIVLLHFKTQI